MKAYFKVYKFEKKIKNYNNVKIVQIMCNYKFLWSGEPN